MWNTKKMISGCLVHFFVVLIGVAAGEETSDFAGRLADLEDILVHQGEKLQNFERQLADKESEIASLKSDRASMELKLAQLSLNIQIMRQELASRGKHEMPNNLNSLKTDLNSTDMDNSYKIGHNKLRNTGVEPGMVLKFKRQASENAAFHVYLNGDRCLGNHETIVFDTEETDVSGSYNVHDGIFDAPFTGTYVFTHTLISMNKKYVQTEIIVDGTIKGVVLADTEESYEHSTASVTIVIHVNAGEHVFVRRRRGSGGCDIASTSDVSYTTFSGWFLF